MQWEAFPPLMLTSHWISPKYLIHTWTRFWFWQAHVQFYIEKFVSKDLQLRPRLIMLITKIGFVFSYF